MRALVNLRPGVSGSTGKFVNLVGTPVDSLLNQKIVVESSFDKGYLDQFLDRDIIPALNAMTGAAFTSSTSSALRGVVRVRRGSGLGSQEYRITASRSSDTLIEGGGLFAQKYGLYRWLRLLGYRQLAPGPLWEIKPARSDIRLVTTIQEAPLVKSVTWAPQGSGTGPVPDSDNRYFDYDWWFEFFEKNARPILNKLTYTTPVKWAGVPSQDGDGNAYYYRSTEFNAEPLYFAQFDPDWHRDRDYLADESIVIANAKKYIGITSGHSALVGSGPSGTGPDITDGTAHWAWLSNVTRYSGGGAFHNTHNGTVNNADPDAPAASDYSANSGIYPLYAGVVVDTIDVEVAHSGADPYRSELRQGVSLATGDGTRCCACTKCMNVLRGTHGIAVDAQPIDRMNCRNTKLIALVTLARPDVEVLYYDFAYDKQSAPATPGYPIDPKMNIMVAAWLFQGDNWAPWVSVETWFARAALDGFKSSIYEFQSLPAYSRGDAGFQVSVGWDRTRRLTQQTSPLDTLFIETTRSVGAMGMTWWGHYEILWGSTKTNTELMAEWASHFGPAAPHMLALFTRWWGTRPGGGTQFDEFEGAKSCALLALADAAVASDPVARPRVAAYQSYAIFLWQLFRWGASEQGGTTPAWQAAHAYSTLGVVVRNGATYRRYILTQTGISAGSGGPSGTGTNITDNTCRWDLFDEPEVFADAMLKHVWRNYRSAIIDSTHVHDWLVFPSAHSPNLSAAFVAKWEIPGDPVDFPAWRTLNGIVDQDTDAQIRSDFAVLAARFTPIPAQAVPAPILSSFSMPFTPTGSTIRSTNNVWGYQGTDGFGWKFTFHVKAGAVGVLRLNTFRFTLPSVVRIKLTNAETGAAISVEDAADAPRQPDYISRDINLSALSPGYYDFSIENDKLFAGLQLECRDDLPITANGMYANVLWVPAGPLLWARAFWVPRGQTQFHLMHCDEPAQAPPTFFDGDDNPVSCTLIQGGTAGFSSAYLKGTIRHVYRVDVPVGQDHRAWIVKGLHSGIPGGFLDMDNRFSPTRAQLIVPTNIMNL